MLYIQAFDQCYFTMLTNTAFTIYLLYLGVASTSSTVWASRNSCVAKLLNFQYHYSSFQCHMILQKSFYYADLLLIKKSDYYQYWKQMSHFVFLWKLIVFFINKCLTDHKVLNNISSSVSNLFKQITCVDFMLRWCSVTTYYNLNNNWTIWDYSILICKKVFRDRRVLVIQWNNNELLKCMLSLLSRTLCSVRDRFGSVQKNESDVQQRTHH